MKVGFYLQSGVEILDFAGPMEVFNYSGYDVITISKNKDQVFVQGILKVTPDYDLEDAPSVDILVFFGGNAILPSKDPKLIEWLKQQKNTKYYFSVCSGALILAEAGILNGKQATTFRNTLDVLEQNYPKIDVLRGVRYVDNGNVITTAGVSAGIDGALHMVAKLNSLAIAGETAFYMEYDWVPNRGVVPCEENPYKDMNNIKILQQYRGVFMSISTEEISIKLNKEQGQLHLFKEGRLFPIFYLEKDRFLTSHSSHIMNFKRNEKDIIIGLETSEYRGVFFKKQ
ncbi:DJ-1/PfpI family protein [Aquimarina algiphila]|uniref:DJ-1/PfpI family protein n=2 Tax=Flavobacteriaceae TaxID=49546 RepID=A0A554VDV0_9FLAO|nr:DJ-1/PfpI family protein [Aquimarina algiphila]